MLMLADLKHAEQQLANIKQLITDENYAEATESVEKWQKQLQLLFAQHALTDAEQQQRLQQLSDDFFDMLASLNVEHQKIKHSISRIAAVKSGNKISKTYQID